MTESDWKQFRKSVEFLRERYLEEKNRDLASMLRVEGKTPTEQFWDTLEAMQKEKRILQNCLDGHSRSKMIMSMHLMLRHGMLRREELTSYSEELQNELKSLLE